MKKLASVVAALVLCFAMTTTAFAASPVKATLKSAPEGTTLSDVSGEVAASITTATTADKLEALVGSKTATVVSVFDLAGTTAGEVEVAVTGIKSGDTVKVLHWVGGDMTKAPEVLGATAGDGSVKFTTSSYSPFAVVLVNSAAAASTTATSPKTSEAETMTAIAVMLISAAGIVVLNRKKIA